MPSMAKRCGLGGRRLQAYARKTCVVVEGFLAMFLDENGDPNFEPHQTNRATQEDTVNIYESICLVVGYNVGGRSEIIVSPKAQTAK